MGSAVDDLVVLQIEKFQRGWFCVFYQITLASLQDQLLFLIDLALRSHIFLFGIPLVSL